MPTSSSCVCDIVHHSARPPTLGAIRLIMIAIENVVPQTHSSPPTLAWVGTTQPKRAWDTVPPTKRHQVRGVRHVEVPLPVPWHHLSPPARASTLVRPPIHQPPRGVPMVVTLQRSLKVMHLQSNDRRANLTLCMFGHANQIRNITTRVQ